MSKQDFEIGDYVVFAKPTAYSHDLRKWSSGKIADVAGNLVEIEFRSLFGFYRRKWVEPGDCHRQWKIERKDRAEEMIARYQSNQ